MDKQSPHDKMVNQWMLSEEEFKKIINHLPHVVPKNMYPICQYKKEKWRRGVAAGGEKGGKNQIN